MKKVFAIFSVFVVLGLFAACSTSSDPESEFSEFSMDGDLSWLEGTWELTKWETNNHGIMQDDTDIYDYQLLIINGGAKDSELVEESKDKDDGTVSRHTYTVEGYFMMNSHEKGHSNKVNQSKTQLLLSREFALDEDIIFNYTFRKR